MKVDELKYVVGEAQEAKPGSNDIGKVLYVTSPIMKQAVKAINTAIGRWIKNFIMFFYLSINSTNHSSLTR